MAKIDGRVVRKLAEALERIVHLLHRALEHAAATKCEERVGGKEQLVVRQVVANMAERVARRQDDLDRWPANSKRSPSSTVW